MALIGELLGLKIYNDGSVRRSIPEVVVSTMTQSCKNYKFKDVVMNPQKPVTGRLFIPDITNNNATSATKLPVLVFFHGGGFCIGSTTWIYHHHFLGDLAAISQSVIVSADYRLAPENRLPAAYEDCYSSLEWLSHQASSEPWLQNADLSRVFLCGDSAGGNIVHHVTVKTIKCNNIFNLAIKGLLLIHPFFGSEKRTEKEKEQGAKGFVEMSDMLWRLCIPEGQDRDYFGFNFENVQMTKEEWSQFPNVVVFVAGLDFLKERGELYAKFLQQMKVKEVQLVEAADESHVFHVFHPESEATRLLQNQISEFMNQPKSLS